MCRPSSKGWATRCSRPSPGSTSRPSSRSGCSPRSAWWRVLALVPAVLAAGARRARCARWSSRCSCWRWPIRAWSRRRGRPAPTSPCCVVDRSDSARIGNRAAQIEAARVALEARARPAAGAGAAHRGGAGRRQPGHPAVRRHGAALADIPRARLAGVIALTDGQVHDVPATSPDRGALPRPAARPARRGRPAPPRDRGAGLRHRRPQRRAARRGRRSRRADRGGGAARLYDPPRRRAAADRERAGRPRAPHRRSRSSAAARPWSSSPPRPAPGEVTDAQQPRRRHHHRRARPAARAAGLAASRMPASAPGAVC